MNLNVLLSCMHEKDTSIVKRNNIQTDVVVVNQCDYNAVTEYDFLNNKGNICHVKFINTTERGLSRSRNMAINNAWGDICLIADDDEKFADDYEDIIIKAFDEIQADVIAFGFHYSNRERDNFTKRTRIRWHNFLKICSVQIAFRRSSIITSSLQFQVNMGSGSGNGGGEENKFISDCLKNKLSIYAEPSDIAEIIYNPEESKWFTGFNEDYFIKKGWSIKQSIGVMGTLAFAIALCCKRSSLIKKDMNPFRAFYLMLKGVFSN